MYVFFVTFLATSAFVLACIILFVLKTLVDRVQEIVDNQEKFSAADREFKSSSTQTGTKVFTLLYELEQSLKLRNNLLLDNLDELKRAVVKKDEFERLFELLKREKILIENAADEAEKKAKKEKWSMWSTALGCKEEKNEG